MQKYTGGYILPKNHTQNYTGGIISWVGIFLPVTPYKAVIVNGRFYCNEKVVKFQKLLHLIYHRIKTSHSSSPEVYNLTSQSRP